MNLSFSDKTLFIDTRSKKFAYPIRDVKEYKNLILVLFTVPKGEIDNRNVIAINNMTLELVWRIEEADLIYEDCPYINLIDTSDVIIIGNWNGILYKIDDSNGRILEGIQTK